LLRDYEFVFRQRWRELDSRTKRILLRGSGGEPPEQSTLSPGDIEHLERQGVFNLGQGWIITRDQPFMDWMKTHREGLVAEDEGDK
jgi:hypothetical protein